MNISADYREGRLRFLFRGELDHHGAKGAIRRIEKEIDLRLPGACVLDLGGLSFMDSSGIAVILRARRRMDELGGTLAVENVPPQPQKVLQAAKLDRIVTIRARKEAAV